MRWHVIFRLAVPMGLLFTLIFLWRSSSKEEGESVALRAYVAGAIERSEEVLDRCQKELPPGKFFFIKTCLAEEKGEHARSERYEQKALAVPLLVALRAYRLGDFEKWRDAVPHLKQQFYGEWGDYFCALESSLEGDFPTAFRRWISYFQERKERSGEWISAVVDRRMGRYRPHLCLARCYIERNKTAEARRFLQNLYPKLSETEKETYWWLMGLSLLKQGNSFSCTEGAAEFFAHLTQVSDPWLLKDIKRRVSLGIREQSLRELVLFTDLFERLGDQDSLDLLVDSVCAQVAREVEGKEDVLFTQFLAVSTENRQKGLLCQKIRESLLLAFQASVLKGNVSKLDPLAQHLLACSEEPEVLRGDLLYFVQSHFVDHLLHDDRDLSMSKELLSFWERWENNLERRAFFASELFSLSKRLWSSPSQRKKATRLVSLITVLNDVGHCRKLQNWVNQLYREAVQGEEIEQLPSIWELAKELHLERTLLSDPQEIASLLEDARFYCSRGWYAEAKKRALWVTQVSPQNSSAKELLGVIAYQEHDYAPAAAYLEESGLPSLRETRRQFSLSVAEAYAVSHFLEGKRGIGEKYINSLPYLSDDLCRRLAFGLLAAGQIEEGSLWLGKLSEEDEEVVAGRAFAACERGDWADALPLLSSLSPLFEERPSVRVLYLRALWEQGGREAVGREWTTLFSSAEKQKNGSISPTVSDFLRRKERSFDQNYLTALFFKWIEPNPELCLQALEQVPELSWEGELDRVEALWSLGEHTKARTHLESVLAQGRPRKVQEDLYRRVALFFAAEGEEPSVQRPYLAVSPSENVENASLTM